MIYLCKYKLSLLNCINIKIVLKLQCKQEEYMSKWLDIYQSQINREGKLKYYNDKIRNKKKLINLIKKYSPNKKIIELGCGTAIISNYFASLNYKVACVDIDENMINLAKTFVNTSKKSPVFVLDDIREFESDEQYDVSFSNGVLEHFSNKEINQILKHCKNFSKYTIIGVPTRFFNQEESMYGDERYLSKKDWIRIFKKNDAIVMETKYYDYRNFIKQVFQIKKWFRPKPYLVFVLRFNQH